MEFIYQKDANLDQLTIEINAGLPGKLIFIILDDHIELTVAVNAELTAEEEATLDQTVQNHVK